MLEVERQIVVELIELNDLIRIVKKELPPSHIVTMYQGFINQKRDELVAMSDEDLEDFFLPHI